jgi:hypothetical protein
MSLMMDFWVASAIDRIEDENKIVPFPRYF